MVRNGIPIILSKQQFESYDFNRGRKMYSKHMGKVIDIDRNFFFSQQITKYWIVVGVAIKISYSNIEMHLEMSWAIENC